MNPADDPARDAESSARQALNHARSAMERTLAELDRYIVRYENTKGLKDKADVLNWTIHHLATHLAANVRLDLLAHAQAELARADLAR